MEYHEEKLARAISAYSRRQILRLLATRDMTVKEIATSTNMSMSLASRHLSMLRDLGFLDVQRKTPFKYYSLKIKEIVPLLNAYDKVITKL
jgi:DNA-binding transcriptional ArsR family regulator